MPVMLERWNDDKMDALTAKVDGTAAQLREHRRETREDMRELRQEMKELRQELKDGFERMGRTLDQPFRLLLRDSIRAVPTTQIRRGGQVAQALGWPSKERGFIGALGGLIDPASFEFRKPQSALLLVHHYQRQSDAAVRERVLHGLQDCLWRQAD